MLVATAISTGVVIAQAPVVMAQETTTQTMAEQYQPVYEPVTERTDESFFIYPEAGLPRETVFELYKPNWPWNSANPLYREEGPLLAYSSVVGLWVGQTASELKGYGNKGYTADFDILVSYPDASQEVVTATVTVISTMATLTTVKYADTWIDPSSTKVISPANSDNPPEQYSFLLSSQLDAYREQGWNFSINPATGEISVTAPDKAGLKITLPVSMSFADGSDTIVDVVINSGSEPEPIPEPEPDTESDSGSSLGGSSFGGSS
ncbi:hypothetical protein C5L39_10505 [Corynebacterium alimapuense]|uniref:Long Rib domain-containing protein n=2 Tax=Corynebacterium alimapuense TaxID=1576874 RepID=A0A3M8K5C1_9CORY|nr:hypothetical protein C5L39_10505 [Corynebacterium alimapuense]